VFVQLIRGWTDDRDAVRSQLERWDTEVRPGALGFVGTTAGIAADGTVVVLAQFEDEASARANSERAEQTAWWEQTSKLLDRRPTFIESTDVGFDLRGPSPDAGFVQVVEGRTTDRDAFATGADLAAEFARFRPDYLGGLYLFTGGDRFVQAVYFTSEAEAREGERHEPPPELLEAYKGMVAAVQDASYVDLTEPIVVTAPGSH
jgi:hypothetical protein